MTVYPNHLVSFLKLLQHIVVINFFVTGNTLVCDKRYKPVKEEIMYEVEKEIQYFLSPMLLELVKS